MTLEVDIDELARAVGHRVSSYDVEPIDPQLRIHSVTGGVFRVRGEGFSVVLKIVRHGVDDDPGALWVSGADPSHRNYWKREWLAFDSGLLDALPGRLRAPRTLLTTEHDDGDCWIWMEDVGGAHGSSLALHDYETIATDLGSTQGAYAAGTAALPDHEWLARDWLRGWVGASAAFVEQLRAEDVTDDRLGAVRSLRERALAVWDARDALFAIVDAAPRTVVHCDFWPTNLFLPGDGTTVAIDWSQVGIGALAQDLDQLTLDPIWMQVRPDESIEALEGLVIGGYAAGMRSAGVDVDDAQLQRWYAAAAALHYPQMAGSIVVRTRDPADVAAMERRFGRDYRTLTDDRARVVARAIELGEWALESAQ